MKKKEDAHVTDASDATNKMRAQWAQVAVDAFAVETILHNAGEDDETMISDLLADMMHLCDQKGLSFDALIMRAKTNFDSEKRGD